MPGSTETSGAASTPANPASMAPTPNTMRNSRRTSTPSAETIAALLAPARISMPSRVRLTTQPEQQPRPRAPRAMSARR